LYSYTYASNNAPFNSNEPHKPEFLLYFDTNLKIIDNTYSLNAASLNDRISSVYPQANQIPVLDANTNLVLPYTNAIITKNYTFRRVDLSNATSDYPLAVGEEAIYKFTNITKIPLNITTYDGTVYELHIISSNPGSTSGAKSAVVYLYPNNTVYTNNFIYVEIGFNSYTYVYWSHTYSAFRVGAGYPNSFYIITNRTVYKNAKGFDDCYGSATGFPIMHIATNDWQDTTTSWTSLGTIVFPQNTSGEILIKRIK
jgi:hypothetical protein